MVRRLSTSRPQSVPLALPSSVDDAFNIRAALRGICGVTAAFPNRKFGMCAQNLRKQAYGIGPVNWRFIYRLRAGYRDYRKARIEELRLIDAEHQRWMAEERALLEWSRHHLDELIRRRKLAKGELV